MSNALEFLKGLGMQNSAGEAEVCWVGRGRRMQRIC